MKKLILIAGLILAVIIGGYVYYKYSYPYSGNAGKITEDDLRCKWYYGSYSQKKVGTPSYWEHSLEGTKSAFWHAPGQGIDWGCRENNNQIIGGCSGVSLENQAECCENWAEENGIFHIQCTGNWSFDYNDNHCEWKCASE